MIVVDVETTGLDPQRCSIVSIGAVDFFRPDNKFYSECRIFDDAFIEDEALKINGFTRKQIKDPNKNSLDLLLNKFVEWSKYIDNITLAGENVSFDRDFLKESFRRCRLSWPFGHRVVDLHSISYYDHLINKIDPPLKDSKTALSLDKTLAYVGLPPEPKPHNALVGAKLEAEAFYRLMYPNNGWFFEEYKEFRNI